MLDNLNPSWCFYIYTSFHITLTVQCFEVTQQEVSISDCLCVYRSTLVLRDSCSGHMLFIMRPQAYADLFSWSLTYRSSVLITAEKRHIITLCTYSCSISQAHWDDTTRRICAVVISHLLIILNCVKQLLRHLMVHLTTNKSRQFLKPPS